MKKSISDISGNYLVVGILGMHVCINISHIEKVIQLSMLDRVPGAPDNFVGLLNYRGSTLPVYDLAMTLGLMRNNKYQIDSSILICSSGNQQTGFIVDMVIEQTIINLNEISHDERVNNANNYFSSAVIKNGTTMIILDIKKIISELLANESTSLIANRNNESVDSNG